MPSRGAQEARGTPVTSHSATFARSQRTNRGVTSKRSKIRAATAPPEPADPVAAATPDELAGAFGSDNPAGPLEAAPATWLACAAPIFAGPERTAFETLGARAGEATKGAGLDEGLAGDFTVGAGNRSSSRRCGKEVCTGSVVAGRSGMLTGRRHRAAHVRWRRKRGGSTGVQTCRQRSRGIFGHEGVGLRSDDRCRTLLRQRDLAA